MSVGRWNCIASLRNRPVQHCDTNPLESKPALYEAQAMDHKDRILIVDDDPEIRQLLVDYLVRNGFEAIPAASGRELWQMLNRHSVDLVVLDLMLPDTDGLVLCRDPNAHASPCN